MNLEPDNKLGYLQQLYKMHQWNHNQPEKSSISDGLETSHSKMKPELMSNRGSSSLQPDDATPLTLFQTPLMQAAIRQQQMQFFTQLANLGYPFLPMSGSVQPMAHPPVQPFTHSYSPFSNCKTKSQNTSFITNSPKFLTPTFSATQPDLSLNCSKSDVLTSTTTFTSKLTSNKSSKQNFGYRCPDSNLSSSSLDMRNKDIDLSSSVTTSSMAQSITSARKRPRSSHKGNLSLNGGSLDGPSGKEKVFTCNTCNRSFGYKHVLQNHERTHTGEKPFECRVCNKRFTRDHHLKTHMRLHTGEKPYSCTHCDRQFVQVANLRRHLRVHTGEKPYSCSFCESNFSDSNQLKAHILIHKGEKPFICEKCHGKFRRRHHLMNHACSKVTNFHDEKPKFKQEMKYSNDDSLKKFQSVSSHFVGLKNWDKRELDNKHEAKNVGFLPSPEENEKVSFFNISAGFLPSPEENEKVSFFNISARSRKSRDPKKVRLAANQVQPKTHLHTGKILSSSFFESDIIEESDNWEKLFQSEPEDLSSSSKSKEDTKDIQVEDEKENDLDLSTTLDCISGASDLGGPPTPNTPIIKIVSLLK